MSSALGHSSDGPEAMRRAKEAERLVAKYLPVMGLAGWNVEVYSYPTEWLNKYVEGNGIMAVTDHVYVGSKTACILISSDFPFDAEGRGSVEQTVIHELGHIVATELGYSDLSVGVAEADQELHRSVEERFCDRFAYIVTEAMRLRLPMGGGARQGKR